MISKSSFVIIAACQIGLAAQAGAQQGMPPPGAQGGQPPAMQQQPTVSVEQAIRIANQQGLVSVEKIERDENEWEIEGRDAQGREIEVEIDATTGQVINIDR